MAGEELFSDIHEEITEMFQAYSSYIPNSYVARFGWEEKDEIDHQYHGCDAELIQETKNEN